MIDSHESKFDARALGVSSRIRMSLIARGLHRHRRMLDGSDSRAYEARLEDLTTSICARFVAGRVNIRRMSAFSIDVSAPRIAEVRRRSLRTRSTSAHLKP